MTVKGTKILAARSVSRKEKRRDRSPGASPNRKDRTPHPADERADENDGVSVALPPHRRTYVVAHFRHPTSPEDRTAAIFCAKCLGYELTLERDDSPRPTHRPHFTLSCRSCGYRGSPTFLYREVEEREVKCDCCTCEKKAEPVEAVN
jgi:hypothetical protein